MGYVLLGVWAFVLYCALYSKISDIEKRLDSDEDYEPCEQED